MVSSIFGTFSGITSKLNTGRFSARSTPLRSKISPRLGAIGTTLMRLSLDRVL
ncbi:Uncharacterised protein [Vibrio cholerae]|nr:Uncharacterised protein [Vibrio cholerae]